MVNRRLFAALFTLGLSLPTFAVPPAYFHCGDSKVVASFYDENKLLLTIDGKEHELVSVMSGSGAKYETPKGTKPFVMFWNKGTQATIEVDAKALPLCHQEKAPHKKASSIIDQEWQVAHLDNKAPNDQAKLTLMFNKNGKLAGFSGCNRFGGSYTLEGAKLTIQQNMFSTRMACLNDDLMQQETQYLQLLATMTHAKLTDNGELLLSNEKQQTILLKS